MKKLALKELDSLFAAIAAQQALYLPAGRRGRSRRSLLPGRRAQRSPSGSIPRARPRIYSSRRWRTSPDSSGKGNLSKFLRRAEDIRPFTVFGVRACDARSFEILDKVFLKEPVDTFYASRREMGTRYHARLHEAGRDLLLPELRHRPCQSCGRRVVLDG